VAEGVEPWAIEELALHLPQEQWPTVRWREGRRGEQSSRFAAVRVHTAERHVHNAPPSEEVWLLLEWPKGEKTPTKSALSSLPADTSLQELVRLWKLRWRVERDHHTCCCVASATARSAFATSAPALRLGDRRGSAQVVLATLP